MWSLLLVCSLSFADTAEDTALEDTAIEDTAIEDTASLGEEDTADTASTDTGSTTGTTDTTTETTDTSDSSSSEDTSWIVPASTLANEKGGIGCSTVGIGGMLLIWIASFVIGFRKE